MIMFQGSDITRKWVIVKGKKVLKLLADRGGVFAMGNNYYWLDQDQFLPGSEDLLVFDSQERAVSFLKTGMPDGKQFKDARVQLLTVNIS